MNILFLSLSRFESVESRGLYPDLLREFIRRGCNVFVALPTERRFGKPTHLIEQPHCQILKVRTLNLQKTNVVEKGIGTLLLERQFHRAIRRHWGNVRFDLVLYATPPITFNKVIERVKRRCGARSYLMLKDIFPQNAVDLGMMKSGSLLHRLFRRKEERLYALSDKIGCMSPANCRYVIEHNPAVDPAKVELCPNALEPVGVSAMGEAERAALLGKYGLPTGVPLFVYGGNLGKPQGVDFPLRVIEANEEKRTGYLLIVGSGTEYPRLARWMKEHRPRCAKLLSALPKADYEELVRACQVGLIFLDPRFTIPNFPSRLLSYLQNRMPVLLATDRHTDMGRIAEREGFGLWCESGDLDAFMAHMSALAASPALIEQMGQEGERYFLSHYTVDRVADTIMNAPCTSSRSFTNPA